MIWLVLAAYAAEIDPDDPLRGLVVGERPEPEQQDEWAIVTVRATSLNHHDLWSLRGRGLSEQQLPMILGCDAAGVDEDGNEVIVHAVIGDPGVARRRDARPTPLAALGAPPGHARRAGRGAALEPGREAARAQLRAGRMPADGVADRLPDAVHPRPADPGADDPRPGRERRRRDRADRARERRRYPRLGHRASEEKREYALALGADAAFEPGARLPERVDAVMETTGAATWVHSIRALKPGGTIVISGATTGDASPAELTRIFFLQLSVVGSTMGTRDELARLIRFCVDRDVRPTIDRTLPLAEAREGFAAMLAGDLRGKIVFTV